MILPQNLIPLKRDAISISNISFHPYFRTSDWASWSKSFLRERRKISTKRLRLMVEKTTEGKKRSIRRRNSNIKTNMENEYKRKQLGIITNLKKKMCRKSISPVVLAAEGSLIRMRAPLPASVVTCSCCGTADLNKILEIILACIPDECSHPSVRSVWYWKQVQTEKLKTKSCDRSKVFFLVDFQQKQIILKNVIILEDSANT